MSYYYQPMYNPPVPDHLAQMRQQQYPPQQYQQPQYQQFSQCFQQAPLALPNHTVIRVRSEMEGSNFLVAPNNAVTMYNENGMEVYLKTADASGKPEFETFVKRPKATRPSENPNDEIITLGKLMNVLTNLGLMPENVSQKVKEDTENE